VKGTGEETFYRYGNCLSELKKAQSDRHAPEIVSVDRFLTDGQMPSLYTSCHCLIAPYRGEGFGLPILEAMACGLPAIVPIGGATDDFVTVKTGFLLNAEERESRHDWKLAGPCLELNVRTSEIRKTMREAFETRQRTREMGMRAAKYVSTHYPWARAISQMNCRIQYLATQKGNDKDKKLPNGNLGSNKKLMTIGIVVTAKVRQLPECLSRLQTLSEDIIVFDQTHDRRTPSIAHEYGVQIRPISRTTKLNEIRKMIKSVADSDWTVLFRPETQITPKVALDIRNYLNTLPAQRESAQYSIENRATGRAKTSRIRFERA
jgi:hypothetical protein